jgi:putative hydrolase of HD superfamily
MATPELAGMANYLYEIGLLKRLPRAGWLVAGVDRPESVAEHSFRAAVIGYLLAQIEGADPARTALLCLFHDTQETRVGDVPRIGKRYVTTAPNPQVTADQVAGLPDGLGRAVRALVDDYEGQDSAEARLARDADKLECLIQAREYQAHGHDVQPWVDTAAADLRSPTASRLADQLQRTPPDQWWKAFAAG